MTQEEKELLIRDLCARLPYGVKVIARSVLIQTLYSLENDGKTWYVNPLHSEHGNIFPLSPPIEECKPYLRPMSSMTEAEEIYYNTIYTTLKFYEKEDWLNAHHFDYRIDPSTGKTLIESGLALEAKEGMYKID